MSETSYRPIDITPPELRAGGIVASIAQGWVGDPELDPRAVDYTRRQTSAIVPFQVVDGLPVNPVERTGRVGRNLGRWAENPAADPAVVAGYAAARRILLIRRSDCGLWALPGGMVESGETTPAALARELAEETGVDLSAMAPVVLARRYVADRRNTDWAWVCTTLALFQLPAEVPAFAGDDAAEANWFPFADLAALHAVAEPLGGVYEAHWPLLSIVLQHLNDRDGEPDA